MKKNFIPYDKMSKKEKKQEDNRNRVKWNCSPRSIVIPNKKKDRKNDYYDDF